MKLNAALDPIIALLVGLGWIIVKALQSRKKDQDSWGETIGPAAPPQAPPPQPAVLHRGIERTSPNRPLQTRPLQPRPVPASAPPLIRTATATTAPPQMFAQDEAVRTLEAAVLKDSEASYARAAHLQQAVAARLSDIEKQTSDAKPTPVKPRVRSAAATHILRTMRNPMTVRQAFLASFVLNPPKALE